MVSTLAAGTGNVNQPETLTIDINGFATRVWRKGSGPKLGFLAGFGGLPRWVPFLDELAKSRTVIVYCLNAECDASPKAVRRMEKLGYKNVFDYEAGKVDWKEAGLPVEP